MYMLMPSLFAMYETALIASFIFKSFHNSGIYKDEGLVERRNGSSYLVEHGAQ